MNTTIQQIPIRSRFTLCLPNI